MAIFHACVTGNCDECIGHDGGGNKCGHDCHVKKAVAAHMAPITEGKAEPTKSLKQRRRERMLRRFPKRRRPAIKWF